MSLRCALHCEDNIVIEYLNEIENEFENTAVCLSRAQMGPKNEKNRDQKSRDTLPFTMVRELVLHFCDPPVAEL